MDIACLRIIGRRLYECYFLWLLHVGEYALLAIFAAAKGIAELSDIFHDELSCLVFAGHACLLPLVCVCLVVVPIEEGVTVFFEILEQGYLCLVEDVETHHGVCVRGEFAVHGMNGSCVVGIEIVDDESLQHAFVEEWYAVGGVEQCLSKMVVDGYEIIP